MEKYVVKDFYENPFGEAIYIASSEDDAKKFMNEFIDATDGECKLIIQLNTKG